MFNFLVDIKGFIRHEMKMVVFIFILFVTNHMVYGTFTTNPPAMGSSCTGDDRQITWQYTSLNGIIVVQWKKGVRVIMEWDPDSNAINYGQGFSAANISHDNSNGQITLINVDTSFTGEYSCEYIDSVGDTFTSGQLNLQVYDLLNTVMNCSCNTKEIRCNLADSVSGVTINNTVEHLPFEPTVIGSYIICMTGGQINCLANNVPTCETVELCPSGHDSTTTEPTADTEQSSFAVSMSSSTSTLSSAIGTGKDETSTVYIISTYSYANSYNDTVFLETKNMFAPLVISVSVVSFCFGVISCVVICRVYYKRRSYRNRSGKYSDLEPPFNERQINQERSSKCPNNGNGKTNDAFVPSRFNQEQRFPELSHDSYTQAVRNIQQRDKYEKDNVQFNNRPNRRQTLEMVYVPHAYCRNERNSFGQQRQMSNYNLNHDPQRREKMRQNNQSYSFHNYCFYRG